MDLPFPMDIISRDEESADAGNSTDGKTEVCRSSLQPVVEDSLPDELWFQVFTHLPEKSIYSSRCVSKQWNSLLQNPYLLYQVLEKSSTSPCTIFCNAAGSFVNLDPVLSRITSKFKGFMLRIPYEKQCARSDDDGSNPFKYSRTDDPDRKVHLLGSSSGLVLCSTTGEYQIWYYICNPLTNEWVLVPNPNGRDDRWVLNGLYCDASSSRGFETTTTYKVIRIPEILYPYKMFDIEVFGSETGEWSTHKVSSPEDIVMAYPFHSNLVCTSGILYWIEGLRKRLVTYNLNTNVERSGRSECWLIDLPLRARGIDDDEYYCLGESEGFICYSQRRDAKVCVWVLEDGKHWDLVHEITLAGSDKPLAFDPTDRNVLILGAICSTSSSYAYNVITKKKEQLKQYSSSAYGVLPFTIRPSPSTALHQNKLLQPKPAAN